jgi:uracil phosphoribosyltransferase
VNVHVIKHPLIEHKLSILRDERTEPFQFRLLVDEISYLMLFESTRDLPLRDVKVQTPVAMADCKKLDSKLIR